MNRKRRVIFYINPNLQYTSEFHENTKIKMIKSYLKDVSHIEQFKLISNNSSNIQDDSALKEINALSKEIFFRVIKVLDQNSIENESHIEELLKENIQLNSQITDLKNLINDFKTENGILIKLDRK